MLQQSNHLANPELLGMAAATLFKRAFVSAGDPSMGGGGGGGDPAQGGGQPPPGGDPSGGAAAGGGGGGVDPTVQAQATAAAIAPLIQGQGGGMGGGGMEPIKPKIDVNVTLMQILKILAKLADTLHVPIPASDMVANQGDLTQFGMQQQQGQDMPATAGGGAGGGPQPAIQPVQPMQPGMAPGGGGAGGMPAAPKAAGDYYNNGRGVDRQGTPWGLAAPPDRPDAAGVAARKTAADGFNALQARAIAIATLHNQRRAG